MSRTKSNPSQAQTNVLGYSQITSSFTTTSGSPVQVTGLSAIVTIPGGGRNIKITAFCRDLYNTNVGAYVNLDIWDGAVGTGTKLSGVQVQVPSSGITFPGTAVAVVSPSAGSKTYNVSLSASPGTSGIEAGTTFPAFILVEVI